MEAKNAMEKHTTNNNNNNKWKNDLKGKKIINLNLNKKIIYILFLKIKK
jgi:hypothetical protein